MIETFHRRDFNEFAKQLMFYHFDLEIKSSLFDEQREEFELYYNNLFLT